MAFNHGRGTTLVRDDAGARKYALDWPVAADSLGPGRMSGSLECDPFGPLSWRRVCGQRRRRMARFGFRVPSPQKRLSARTSLKRYARNNLRLKAPHGWGWIANPRRAAYNRVYNQTTRGCLGVLLLLGVALSVGIFTIAAAIYSKSEQTGAKSSPHRHRNTRVGDGVFWRFT